MLTLKQQLMHDEGLRLHPYRDTVGKLTIGFGRNLDDVGITRREAEIMLDNDIEQVRLELSRFDWFDQLDSSRRDVIMNMCFNLGLPTLLKFENMIAALSSHQYQRAADEMLDSKWARQVGDRAERLAEVMRNEHC